MSLVLKNGDRLVIAPAIDEDAEARKVFDFQLLSPLLLGLLLPFILASYFAPETLVHLKTPIWIFLICMFFLCTGLFIYTVLFPGTVHSVVIHRDSRSVEIEWRSLLSTTSQVVNFLDISAIRVRSREELDGAEAPMAELVLRSRAVIALPTSTTQEQLKLLRASIGLG